MSDIVFKRIGLIHSPFSIPEGMPIQPKGAFGIRGHIELDPRYVDGLKDLAGFSHIHLLYHFHKNTAEKLRVIPFLDKVERGIFATRAPARPNSIGMSVVKIVGIDGTRIDIENVDILDGTPLLDIKPYAPVFDYWAVDSSGWLAERGTSIASARADKRFT